MKKNHIITIINIVHSGYYYYFFFGIKSNIYYYPVIVPIPPNYLL